MTNETPADYLSNAKPTPSDDEGRARDTHLYLKRFRAFENLARQAYPGLSTLEIATLYAGFEAWREIRPV